MNRVRVDAMGAIQVAVKGDFPISVVDDSLQLQVLDLSEPVSFRPLRALKRDLGAKNLKHHGSSRGSRQSHSAGNPLEKRCGYCELLATSARCFG